MEERKKRFGDRYDGRQLRKIDPIIKIAPFIMKSRVDSLTYFEEKIYFDNIDEFLKNKRRQGIRDIKFLHIIIAAMVRTMSQKPRINRFIAGQRIYARDEILVSISIKKDLTDDGTETTMKLSFNPSDTLRDVVEKVNSTLEENKKEENSNDTDKLTKFIMYCPRFIIRFIVWFLTTLDYYGIMPKAINKVSPFHTSVYVTDLGSLGIQPVYHHIYNFGTTSVFVAFGAKKKELAYDENNNIVQKKYVSLKVVADERIVDGYYCASTFKLFKRFIENPERLEVPPEKVVEDIE